MQDKAERGLVSAHSPGGAGESALGGGFEAVQRLARTKQARAIERPLHRKQAVEMGELCVMVIFEPLEWVEKLAGIAPPVLPHEVIRIQFVLIR